MECSPPGSSVHGDSPSKNTRVGCHALLQGILPTQGSNPGLPNCRWILYHLSYQGSPRILEWVDYPFSRESSQPRNWTRVSLLQADSLPAAAAAKLLQLCQTLSDPMVCSLPGSSVHGIFQARVLEWGAIAFSTIAELQRNVSQNYNEIITSYLLEWLSWIITQITKFGKDVEKRKP